MAIKIIAICEIIRAIQNMVPIVIQIKSAKNSDNAYAQFIDHLKKTDREFVRDMLEEYERREHE